MELMLLLEKNMKTYVFDIDGTICTIADGNYVNAKPFQDRIKIINFLYDSGHCIIFNTARGMGRYNNNFDQAYLNFYEITKCQLQTWGVKYHQLFMGKPAGDIYVDDKSCHDLTWFSLATNLIGDKSNGTK